MALRDIACVPPAGTRGCPAPPPQAAGVRPQDPFHAPGAAHALTESTWVARAAPGRHRRGRCDFLLIFSSFRWFFIDFSLVFLDFPLKHAKFHSHGSQRRREPPPPRAPREPPREPPRSVVLDRGGGQRRRLGLGLDLSIPAPRGSRRDCLVRVAAAGHAHQTQGCDVCDVLELRCIFRSK